MRRSDYWLTLENGEESTFLTDASMREQYHQKEGTLPVRYYDKHYYFVDWHWHDEIEMTIIQCKELRCDIGKDQITLKRGDCVLINSRVMHRYAPVENTSQESLWDSLLFDPKMIAPIDSVTYRELIAPILDSSREYLVMDRNIPWQREVANKTRETTHYIMGNSPAINLQLRSAITALWIPLAEHMDFFPASEKSAPVNGRQERLRIMMHYIWEHYNEPITLADIVGSAHVSQRTAERCFQEQIQTTPLLYLQNYRLRQARQMLLATQDSILEVALACGFESSSYFDRIFKRAYNETPRQYRKRMLRVSKEKAAIEKKRM